MPSYTKITMESQWQPIHEVLDFKYSELLNLISNQGSLTQMLKKRSNKEINIKALQQQWQLCTLEEQKLLHYLYKPFALHRNAMLLCDSIPLVLAKTIFPHQSLIGKLRALKLLGNQPLGSFIFKQPNMLRTPFEIILLPKNNQLFPTTTEPTWARRSIFWVNEKPILVYEAFLASNLEKLKIIC